MRRIWGALTRPREITYHGDEGVDAGYCHIEIRAAGETELYLAGACQLDTPDHHQSFPLTKEKYAVDLSRPDKVRHIDERTWQSAMPMWREGLVHGTDPRHPTDPGISFKGRVFERSGPKWSGVRAGPVGADFSQDGSKISVNSWDGFDIRYDSLDPTVLFQRDKVRGQFWTDIYDTGSGERLIQIQGSFSGADPAAFWERPAGMEPVFSSCPWEVPRGLAFSTCAAC
jgi:hypothetical protein